MDFDGELDLREQRVIGAEGFTKLFYKKGFAPTQNPGCEVEHVEPSYFDNANKIFHQQLVDKAYGH